MDAQAEVSRFTTWWTSELAAVVAARRTRPKWRAMLVQTGPRTFRVRLRQGDAATEVGTLDLDERGTTAASTRDTIAELKLRSGSTDSLVLRLPMAAMVTTKLTFPAGIRDVLDQVLRNQLDRVAPWPPEQALFAYRARDLADRAQIEVELWVTGKAKVEETLAALAAVGLRAGIVDCAADVADEPELNLIGAEHETATHNRRLIGRVLAGGAIAALACGAIGLLATLYLGSARADLDQRISQALTAATAAAKPRGADARRNRDAVLDRRRRAPVLSLMIEALSRALPDDAYLERLQMRDDVVTISGKAQNVPSLIGPLEAASDFDQVQFAAPTTRAEGETSDGFAISARVKPAALFDQARRP